MKVKLIDVQLNHNQLELEHITNSLYYYLTCKECVDNYETLKEFIQKEEETLKLLKNYSLLINKPELYAQVISNFGQQKVNL